jgi:hypothetical protein
MADESNVLLDAALRYAKLGYRVFPCVPGGKSPITEHGFHDATTDAAQIEQWWTEQPRANIGLATEALLVVDIDGRDNSWLANQPDRTLELASVPMALTPRGGSHRVFRQPADKDWRCTEGRLAPKVDTRAAGGYIVAPPSLVESVGAYHWVEGLELDVPPNALAEPPAWLVAELDRLAAGSPTLAHVAAGSPKAGQIPEGQRNATLARLAGAMRRVGMTAPEIAAALHQANADRCVPPVSPREVERIAASIARYLPDEVSVALVENHWGQMLPGKPAPLEPVSLADLVARYPDLRSPVIHGLLRQGETMNVISAPKTGKALAIDTPILTEDGWKSMGELRPGMKVHTANGSLTSIIAVSEVMYDRPCFRVTTRSGASLVADQDHLWSVMQRDHTAVVTTGELTAGHCDRRWLLPVTEPLQRNETPLPLDPWLLGYWLGNGTAREGMLSVHQDDVADVTREIARAGYKTGKPAQKRGCVTFTVRGLRVVLREMGLLNRKQIPAAYLLASHEQRMALLAGLIDSDGHAATQANGSGIVEFTTTDQELFFQTLGLIRSLGYKASTSVGRAMLRGIDCGPKLRIMFAASRRHSPFRLSRRTNHLPERETSRRSHRDAVKSVVPVTSVPVRCIQVAHPSGLFVAGQDFMVTHNSWLVTDLALAIATGRPWLDTFATEPGDVLIIDNELHGETSANRIPKVATARQIALGSVGQRIFVQNLRGRLLDIFTLGAYFRDLQPGRFRVIILDAFYRFMPVDTDENDNGTMANVYNRLDSYADHLGCCFALIHHTSKGNQSAKGVTDVGAGAGSQSRATDTHLVLRPHEQDDVVVLEAAVRSWPPVMPRCLRWAFPVWMADDNLDPSLLRSEKPKKHERSKAADEKPENEWSTERFVRECVMDTPRTKVAILECAKQIGLSKRRADLYLQDSLFKGLVHRWQEGRYEPVVYCTRPKEQNHA